VRGSRVSGRRNGFTQGMSAFSAHDLLPLLIAPVIAGALGLTLIALARAQSRRAVRCRARSAQPAIAGSVARAASTSPAP
jgi:hypothetical protein